jgi:hypothetical protein
MSEPPQQALFGPERLNLKSLRQRAETLRSSIDEMCLALQQGNVITYDNVINRFAVLNTLFRWAAAALLGLAPPPIPASAHHPSPRLRPQPAQRRHAHADEAVRGAPAGRGGPGDGARAGRHDVQ